MSNQRKTSKVLKALQETLDTAEFGYVMFTKGSHPQKLLGLRNFVVFGRAVTNVLQNLKSVEPEFEEWYKKYRDEMQADPLMRYFYNLRSEILKEGKLNVGVGVHIKQLSLPYDMHRFGCPPPNAKSFFIGDNVGGTGWVIQLPNGSEEKYYVDLPTDIGLVKFVFPDPPESYMGQSIVNKSVERLSWLYLNYLKQLVNLAKEKFTTKP
jgi:hypothetical protein